MARAFELAVTPAVFAGIGWLVDRAVGTRLVFTLGLLVFALIGMFVRAWYGYDSAMRAEESRMPSAARPASQPVAAAAPAAEVREARLP